MVPKFVGGVKPQKKPFFIFIIIYYLLFLAHGSFFILIVHAKNICLLLLVLKVEMCFGTLGKGYGMK
jgi:hypothetical protein